MSWIKDVQKEVRDLDDSRKKLREFGLLVGIILVGIGGFFILRRGAGPISLPTVCIGALLIVLGGLAPAILRPVYKLWMGAALLIGWPVARILLGILYFLIVTPIGALGRAFGARFLDLDKGSKRATFWTPRKSCQSSDYEKMF